MPLSKTLRKLAVLAENTAHLNLNEKIRAARRNPKLNKQEHGPILGVEDQSDPIAPRLGGASNVRSIDKLGT